MGWSRTPVEPLRWWVQKVLPTVYDDSLSFQELLGKVVNKLNEVIEQGSALAEYVNTNFTEIREEIADFMTEDEVTNLVNGVAETLRTDYLERLRVVQNDIAALVTVKVDKITTDGPEKVYTVTGTTQGSRECWESTVANSIVKRDQNGRAQISDPVSDYDISNKRYVDTELSTKVDKYNGFGSNVYVNTDGSDEHIPLTTNPTGDGIPRYNQNGGLEVSSVGSNNNSVINKQYFDNHGVRFNTVLSTEHTGTGELVRINPSNIAFFIITFKATSTGSWSTTVIFNAGYTYQRYIMRNSRDNDANTYVDISFSSISGSTNKALVVTESNSSSITVQNIVAVMVD